MTHDDVRQDRWTVRVPVITLERKMFRLLVYSARQESAIHSQN